MGEWVEIEFVRDSEPRESAEAIRKGCRVKVSPASAERWVRRGAAVVVGKGLTTETQRHGEERMNRDGGDEGDGEPGGRPALLPLVPPRPPSALLDRGRELTQRRKAAEGVDRVDEVDRVDGVDE